MKTRLNQKHLTLAVACALALGFTSSAVLAQNLPASERQLVQDTATQVWRNGYGECWHSAYGPAPEFSECNPKPLAQAVVPAPAAAPAPARVVVAAATPQPVYQKVTLDADALFDFDKAELRTAGRDTLSAFVGKLKGINVESIAAVGHTDRLGSDQYNQTLSEARAQAVKTYLLSQGLADSTVKANGMGESQPVTKAGDCTGRKSMKIIACLQPDRRVEVEMHGNVLQK